MKHSIIQPVGTSRAALVQVKNTVLKSNLLELREIERYQHKHPALDIEQAAMSWIATNAARWRKNYSPLSLEV
jgi:hypothetical protein